MKETRKERKEPKKEMLCRGNFFIFKKKNKYKYKGALVNN